MAIDVDNEVTAIFYCKWITIGTLKKLLEELDDKLLLYPNRVGNLSIVEENNPKTIGYIDFNEETIERNLTCHCNGN